MHVAERESRILQAMHLTGFVTYRELEAQLDASPATIRRDLSRLELNRKIERVHGGAKLLSGARNGNDSELIGTPFNLAITQNIEAKRAIGRAAAQLCSPGEGIMIDGGTTTFQMCPHLDGLNCQVLTNSLHIVNTLLQQEGTKLLVPSGAIFREQNIILAPSGEDSMPRFHAPRLFMGAAAVGPQGVMQQDVILVASERRLIDHAEHVVLLVDSSKFRVQSGAIVCGLDEIDTIITDSLPADLVEPLRKANVEVILAR